MANLVSQINYRIIGKDLNSSELFPFETFNPNTETIKEFVERQKGETLVMIQEFDDNYQYAVVNLSNNMEWNSQLITDIAHYERRLKNGNWTPWNSRDLGTINLNSFPNGNKIVTDKRLWLDLITHQIYDEKLNPELVYDNVDEILKYDEEGNLVSNDPKQYEQILKSNLVNFYDYQLYAGIGYTMQSSVIQNVQPRNFE